MAEQDVRPHQLSIRDIARLWCAETGEQASEIEDALSNWAYAEAMDRAVPDPDPSDPGAGPGASTALKIEPDPTRKISWNDLEVFCKDHDRLLPRFWPEPNYQPSAPSRPAAPSEPRRLVIQAMTKLGPLSDNAAAERRRPGPVPVESRERPTPTPVAGRPTGTRTGDAHPTGTRTGNDRPAEPADAENAGRAPAMRTKRHAELVTVWPAPDSLWESAEADPVPVPASHAARREGATRRAGLVGGMAIGAAFGLVLAASAGVLWLEYKGPGLTAFSGQNTGRDTAEAAARARELEQRAARAEGQLAEARRAVDTLRAESRDAAAISQQLAEARARGTELSAALDAMRAEGNDSQKVLLDQLGAARRDVDRLMAEAQANRAEADKLTQKLAEAGQATETAETARDRAIAERQSLAERLAAAQQQLTAITNATEAAAAETQGRIASLNDARVAAESRARGLDADLATARDEIENLTQADAAAQAVIQRLGEELQASRANLDAATTARQDAESKAAALGHDLTEVRAQLSESQTASAAAESEAGRLGAEVDKARLEAAELRSVVAATAGEAKKLADQVQAARRDATAAIAAKSDAEAAAASLSARLAKSGDELTAARAAAKQATDEAARLKPELAAATKAVATAKERLAASEERAKADTAELTKARRRIDDLRTQAARAEAENRSRLSVANSWKTKADELTAALDQATRRLIRLSARNAALSVADEAEKAALIGMAPPAPVDSDKLAAAAQDAAVAEAPKATTVAANSPSGKQIATTRPGAAPSLVARGDEYLGRGDVASARLFYEQAADLGDPPAFTAIGKTYDPAILRRLGILGALASPKQALAWYKRGAKAGDAEAHRRLAELQATLGQ